MTTSVDRQLLRTYPQPVVEIGLPYANELTISPSLSYAERIGASPALPPGRGLEDAGLGIQHLISDGVRFQQAGALFYTVPSGFPVGSAGFTIGLPSFQGSYILGYAPNAALGITLQSAIVFASGATPTNLVQRFVALQETASASYALTSRSSLLAQDQISAPSGPAGATGNRALLGLQQVLSSNVVLDVDYELNVLPAPGTSQHTTVEFGVSVRP